jgi:hypothetical protein
MMHILTILTTWMFHILAQTFIKARSILVPDRSMGPSLEKEDPDHEEGKSSLEEGKQHQVKLKGSNLAEKPFKFNKRGTLKDNEIKELARTNTNIFDWLKPGITTKEAGTSNGLEEDYITGTEEDCLREERLELVRMRRTVWRTTRMCRELLLDMMGRMEFTRIKPSKESVVVLGSQTYPDHHGGVQTPLPRPLTITVKGVEMGWVIGGHTTEDNWVKNNDTPQLGTGNVTEY